MDIESPSIQSVANRLRFVNHKSVHCLWFYYRTYESNLMKRRQLLAITGTTLTVSTAGCGSSDSSDREEGSTDDGSSEEGSTDDGSSEEGSTDDGSSEESSGDEQLIELLDHSFYSEEFSSGVRGTIENVSGETLSYVEVQVFFLDEDETQIGEGLDNTSDLAEGRVWEFDATYLDTDPERIDTYEIETDVTSF